METEPEDITHKRNKYSVYYRIKNYKNNIPVTEEFVIFNRIKRKISDWRGKVKIPLKSINLFFYRDR